MSFNIKNNLYISGNEPGNIAVSSENSSECAQKKDGTWLSASFLERQRKISVNAAGEQREYLRNEWIMSPGNVLSDALFEVGNTGVCQTNHSWLG